MQKAQIYKINSGEKGNEEWLPDIWRQATQQRTEEEEEEKQRDGNVVKGIIGRRERMRVFFLLFLERGKRKESHSILVILFKQNFDH